MDREDIARFRNNLKKHLRGELNAEEKRNIKKMNDRAEANYKRIITNCGGKNPILGF